MWTCIASACGHGVQRRGASLVTDSTSPSMLRGQRTTPITAQRGRMAALAAYNIHDLKGGMDRVPPEGIAFVDTTDPNGQRNLALLRRGPDSVDLLLDNGQQLVVQYRSASEVRAIAVEDLQLQDVVTLDQARIAARYPRLLARFEDTVVLITNDLRNHNLVDARGLLQYKIAWQVRIKALDLKQIIEGDPGRYQVWLDVVPDRDAGSFGAPVAWILPIEGDALPAYRVIWYWEHVPGWKKQDWFPYATRYPTP